MTGIRFSRHVRLGQTWGPHIRFGRVQTLVRQGRPLVKACLEPRWPSYPLCGSG